MLDEAICAPVYESLNKNGFYLFAKGIITLDFTSKVIKGAPMTFQYDFEKDFQMDLLLANIRRCSLPYSQRFDVNDHSLEISLKDYPVKFTV